MFSCRSKKYSNIRTVVINRADIEEQVAHFRMMDIHRFYSYSLFPTIDNTHMMLILVCLALQSPIIQKNKKSLDILEEYLNDIKKRIEYSKQSNQGYYHWLFWSMPIHELATLQDSLGQCFRLLQTFQDNLTHINEGYYQTCEA